MFDKCSINYDKCDRVLIDVIGNQTRCWLNENGTFAREKWFLYFRFGRIFLYYVFFYIFLYYVPSANVFLKIFFIPLEEFSTAISSKR